MTYFKVPSWNMSGETGEIQEYLNKNSPSPSGILTGYLTNTNHKCCLCVNQLGYLFRCFLLIRMKKSCLDLSSCGVVSEVNLEVA